MMNVYIFTIIYDEWAIDIQDRYVVAKTQDEAYEKLEKYNEKQVKKGFARFRIGRCEVYIEDVIK